MNNLFKIILLSALLSIPSGCSDSFKLFVDCSECYIDKPIEAPVKVLLTINSDNPTVPITIYLGPYEDNHIVALDTARDLQVTYWLQIGQGYSFKAEYVKSNRQYHVIDGTKPLTRIDNETCSEPCYYFVRNKVDLRLVF